MTPGPRLAVVQHEDGCPLGLFDRWLGAAGAAVTVVRPAAFKAPVMRRVFGSSVSPAGRFRAANVSGSSPEAGIMNMNGLPGVAPVMRG